MIGSYTVSFWVDFHRGRRSPWKQVAVTAGWWTRWNVPAIARGCNPLEAKRRIRDQRELKRLGTYSPDGKVIASHESRGRLFRRRTGKPGYPTNS